MIRLSASRDVDSADGRQQGPHRLHGIIEGNYLLTALGNNEIAHSSSRMTRAPTRPPSRIRAKPPDTRATRAVAFRLAGVPEDVGVVGFDDPQAPA
jgi:hypothetical protein